jgi:hypothetical protein
MGYNSQEKIILAPSVNGFYMELQINQCFCVLWTNEAVFARSEESPC